jgi:hypothetical protein
MVRRPDAVGSEDQFSTIHSENIGQILVKKAHPILVAEVDQKLRRIVGWPLSRHDVALGLETQHLLEGINRLLDVIVLLFRAHHRHVLVAPVLGAKLMALGHNLFHQVRKGLYCVAVNKKTRLYPLLLQNLHDSVDPYSLAILPIRDRGDVLLKLGLRRWSLTKL